MRVVAFVVTSLALSAAFCQTPQTGAISGTVVDDQGRPAVGIKVAALPLASMAMAVPWKTTGSDGKWQSAGLKLIGYWLVTEDEPAGYPNTMSRLYQLNPQLVYLSPESPVANVVIRLGPKAAVLTGYVTDAVTGSPVRNGGIELWRSDDVKRSIGGRPVQAQYKILLPASTAVSLKFSAPGYQSWYYPGVADASRATSLTLESGQQQTLDVRLQPLP
ncbi:MAG TPA: hypothetical protein VHZ07_10080 [Bryobacteraceae bacterium]|jgi:hypothetical protein|nr:hypothetical protein [Bryobacteraceae bacterium]